MNPEFMNETILRANNVCIKAKINWEATFVDLSTEVYLNHKAV